MVRGQLPAGWLQIINSVPMNKIMVWSHSELIVGKRLSAKRGVDQKGDRQAQVYCSRV
jgi:hypothetical protein